jgi:uncharacterized membrane-anchored protein YhcB (DUF1043 family)
MFWLYIAVTFLVGLFIGFLIAWLLQSEQLKTARELAEEGSKQSMNLSVSELRHLPPTQYCDVLSSTVVIMSILLAFQ